LDGNLPGLIASDTRRKHLHATIKKSGAIISRLFDCFANVIIFGLRFAHYERTLRLRIKQNEVRVCIPAVALFPASRKGFQQFRVVAIFIFPEQVPSGRTGSLPPTYGEQFASDSLGS
jgi:hypothetical protein